MSLRTSLSGREEGVAKLLDGAYLLRDFFDAADGSARFDPRATAALLAERYDPTPAQAAKLERTAENVAMAINIIDSLVARHPLNRKGYFIEKEEVYALVFCQAPPTGHFSVRPLRYAIHFALPSASFRDDRPSYTTLGLQYSGGRYSIRPVLERGERLLSGRRRTPLQALEVLAYATNRQEIVKRDGESVEERLLMAILGKRPFIDEVELHERKHLIDVLIEMPTEQTASEAGARLYAGQFTEPLVMGDCIDAIDVMERRVGRLETLTANDAHPFILEHERRLIARSHLALTALTESEPLLRELLTTGLDPKALSYIVSMTPVPKLPRRLRMMGDHLASCPLETPIDDTLPV